MELDLYNCPVSKVAGYRESIFKLFPGLQLLDRINQQGEEMSASDSDSGLDEDFDDDESMSMEDESEGEDLDNLDGPGNCSQALRAAALNSGESTITLIEDSEESEEEPDPTKKPKA